MKNIEKIQTIIQDAKAILLTAGAGMGVDSGLPDFRGDEGFWKAYPPIKKLGLSFSDMANPKWFESDPALAWAFYGHRLNLYRETTPHEGFRLLFDLVKEKDEDYFIFTSNVDGHFQKAGFDAKKIYEIHGSIHHLQCSHYCEGIFENNENIEVDMENFKAKNIPVCKKCGKVARPNILMFHDWHWQTKRSSKQRHFYQKWQKQKRDEKLVVIEVGAGLTLPTVRSEGEHLSEIYPNTTLIRINPREFEVDERHGYSLALGGLEGIRKIFA